MLDVSSFFTNTFDKETLNYAREVGLGLEIEEYLWLYTPEEIIEKQKAVTLLIKGFNNLSFHGTAIYKEYERISELDDKKLTEIYNDSYNYALYHNINKIIFHSDYCKSSIDETSWLDKTTYFWKTFLKDKPQHIKIYLENFVDDRPDLLSRLCDKVADDRFMLCFDTGHACCNSCIDLNEWIEILGNRIKHVHLHNNDGSSDFHWSLGKGIIDMATVIEKLTQHTKLETFVLECDLNESLIWLTENQIIKK